MILLFWGKFKAPAPPPVPTPPGKGMYVAYPSCSVIDLSRFPQDNIGKSNV